MMVRRISRTAWAASCFWLAASAPALAQFDMDPYRPYNSEFRSFTFPDQNTKYGPGPSAPLFVAPRPTYRLQSFEDRVNAELDADDPIGAPSAPDDGATRPRAGGPESAAQKLAASRRLRDRYYFAAMKETDPKRKTELMEGYRKESRKLEGMLSGNRVAPTAREKPRTPAATAPAPRSPSPSTAAAAAATPRPTRAAAPPR